jgi:hypothetical protein
LFKSGIGVCGHVLYSNENQRERVHQCHSGNQHDCLTEPSYKKGKYNMSKEQIFPVAELNDNQLEKIRSLEEELRQETEENIVLIAYDENM